MKPFCAACLCFFLVAGGGQAQAGSLKDGLSLADESEGVHPLNNILPDAPDWLSRVHGDALFDSASAPRFALETTQPFWQSEALSHTVFGQGRVGWSDGKWTLNFGSGYRYLANDASWLVGGNAFFDTQANDGHKRLGLGGEFMQSYLTFRTNLYKGISNWKVIESTPTYVVEERALSGFDLGAEGPIPYLPWARLYVSHYRWSPLLASDVCGAETKIRAAITSNLSVDVGGSADNQDYSLFTKLRFSFGAPRAVEATAFSHGISDKAFQARDLRKQLLSPVERQNDIATERRTNAVGSVTGVQVIIRRGA